MADPKKKTVSQSRTMWVKKGDVVGGKTVEKGYLAQYGKPEKKVTANVKMVQDTGGVKAGQTQSYSAGRRSSAVAPVSRPASSGKPSGKGSGKSTPPKTDASKDVKPPAKKDAFSYTPGTGAGPVTKAMQAKGKASKNASKKPPTTREVAAKVRTGDSKKSKSDGKYVPPSYPKTGYKEMPKRKGYPGEVITVNGKKYRWTSTKNIIGSGKTESWVQFK